MNENLITTDYSPQYLKKNQTFFQIKNKPNGAQTYLAVYYFTSNLFIP